MYSFQEIREMMHPHLRDKPGYSLSVLNGNRFEISFHVPGASLENTRCWVAANKARWVDENTFEGMAFDLPLIEEFLFLKHWTIKNGIFYATLEYVLPARYSFVGLPGMPNEQYEAVRKTSGTRQKAIDSGLYTVPMSALLSPGISTNG